MKRAILLLLIAVIFIPLNSQDIKVRRIKKVPIEIKASNPDFGSSNREILFMGERSKGLYHYNLRSKRTLTILKKDSNVSSFSRGDNNSVNYTVRKGFGRTAEITEHSYDLERGELTELKKSALSEKRVSVDGKNILLESGTGNTIKISPFDDKYYVWTSFSPDGSRILFTAVGSGTYVSDLEGNILAEIGSLNSPSWINDQWVLGMDDKDDGHVITSSDLCAVHVRSGKRVNLTAKADNIALYPKSSPAASRIIFHNEKGELFIIKIRVKN